ncbi:hypothetical protein ALC60_07469 [Trachymyrmex zeteki]|uniref:Uncharacterized protein n=1 Tax=Mycetomoellerius zeteki TaxID=64791 RepID=A0A151WZT6_9HYME|nr:hypothetical protein ALC60_07469 [Trachymyrmex zeteki]
MYSSILSFTRRITYLRRKVAETIASCQEYNRNYFDKKHKKSIVYKEGDQVLLRNFESSVSVSKKLFPLYKGLYTIIKLLGNDRYLVADIPWLARWLTLGSRVLGQVGKRGGGSAKFGQLRKSSPTSRVGASTWVGIGSRGAGGERGERGCCCAVRIITRLTGRASTTSCRYVTSRTTTCATATTTAIALTTVTGTRTRTRTTTTTTTTITTTATTTTTTCTTTSGICAGALRPRGEDWGLLRVNRHGAPSPRVRYIGRPGYGSSSFSVAPHRRPRAMCPPAGIAT